LIVQDWITLAVAWSFTNLVVPEQVDAERFARIAEFTTQAETLEAFISTPIT
jgi:hypothetical protein